MSKSFGLLQKDEITDISKLVQNHLQSLCDLLGNYFLDVNDFDYQLLRNSLGIDTILLPHSLQDDFIKLLNDSTATDIFESAPCRNFGRNSSHIHWCQKMCGSRLPFPSAYCCEQSFSTVCMMKNKFCARLSIKHDLWVGLSKTLPRIDLLVKQSQAHPSH